MWKGYLIGDLVTLKLPKDELKLSNFITLTGMISYIMKYPVSLGENSLPFYMTNAERIFARRRSNYLTNFYKCQPWLVAAIHPRCLVFTLTGLVDRNYLTASGRSCVISTNVHSTGTAFVQGDGRGVIAPWHYIEPLTHRITVGGEESPLPRQILCEV